MYLYRVDLLVCVSFLSTLILKALLKPLAKKPPNGPTMEAKLERAMLWIWKGYSRTVVCGDRDATLGSRDKHVKEACLSTLIRQYFTLHGSYELKSTTKRRFQTAKFRGWRRESSWFSPIQWHSPGCWAGRSPGAGKAQMAHSPPGSCWSRCWILLGTRSSDNRPWRKRAGRRSAFSYNIGTFSDKRHIYDHIYQNSKHNGGEESTYKPLPSLLRRQLQRTKKMH